MKLSQVEVKLFAADSSAVDQEALIPIFHRWIQEDRLGADAALIDVADYRHVPEGPGVMLVADGAQWRMDEAGGETGLVYGRKRDPAGPAAGKLTEALGRALVAARALEDEPSLGGAVQFGGARLRVTVMSRLVAGHGDYPSFEADLRALADQLYPGDEVVIEQVGGEREALTAEVRAATPVRLSELAARLG